MFRWLLLAAKPSCAFLSTEESNGFIKSLGETRVDGSMAGLVPQVIDEWTDDE